MSTEEQNKEFFLVFSSEFQNNSRVWVSKRRVDAKDSNNCLVLHRLVLEWNERFGGGPEHRLNYAYEMHGFISAVHNCYAYYRKEKNS